MLSYLGLIIYRLSENWFIAFRKHNILRSGTAFDIWRMVRSPVPDGNFSETLSIIT